MRYFFTLFSLILFLSSCTGSRKSATSDTWMLQPIVKLDNVNPVMVPSPEAVFYCPLRKEKVRWEEKDVFNPAAVVKDGRVWLLYRGEDKVGKYNGTSRIGLANSRDGIDFRKLPTPVLYPDNDPMRTFEWEGGCEDPRVVQGPDDKFVMTYTAYDGDKARLCIATSDDLYTWEKHGLAFSDRQQRDLWSKSGAIVCGREKDQITAQKIRDKYWMYWGDTNLYLASSDDLISWTPLTDKKGNLQPVMQPRTGFFDSQLVEPGPFALLTPKGIQLFYNAANSPKNGDKSLPPMTYTVGQALFDVNRPYKLIARADKNFMRPDRDFEMNGQVNNVCFLEGMIWFNGRWLLYYGTADSKIGIAEIRP
ncbi:MAG: glycosidase [Lewinellaceae bacterium]|nr:glycosidase [Lewinellaceae bacterium]